MPKEEIASHKLGVTPEFLDKLQDDSKEADAAYKDIEKEMNGEMEKAAEKATADMGNKQKTAYNAAFNASVKLGKIKAAIENADEEDNPYKDDAANIGEEKNNGKESKNSIR